MQYGPDSWIALNVEGGYYKILAVTGVVVVASYWFDLYDPGQFEERGRTVFPAVAGAGSVGLAAGSSGVFVPRHDAGQERLPDRPG